MKLRLNKKLKIGFIAGVLILMGITSFFLYNEVKNPGFEEQRFSLYSYNNKGNINYEVFLKPNILYETSSLGEGQLYMTEFTDYIQANFIYEFTGERDADLRGDYNIVAKVKGFTSEDEEVQTIWEKNFNLVPKKEFSIKGENHSIKEDLNIRLDEYNEFARAVIEASKINCQTNLSIIMSLNLEGDTDKGSIKDSIAPSMVIPLNTNMFQITGNAIEKPGAIEETTQIQLPVNKNQVTFYGIIIAVLSSILIILIFFTISIPDRDPFERKLKQIFKKHGDRLVALNNEVAVTCEQHREVYSLEDLVRISDEIGKPILYRYNTNYKDINRLYVTDENQMYSLDIHKMLMKPRTERKKNKKSQEKVESDISKKQDKMQEENTVS